jgi:hypothetical protein
MVTHSSTSRPVQCLCMAERTGCPVFTDLWSYVLDSINQIIITGELLKSQPGRYRHQIGSVVHITYDGRVFQLVRMRRDYLAPINDNHHA